MPTTWPRSRRAISATSSSRSAQRGWPRSAARWIAQPGADAPTCVLSASLRLEMNRIALQPQVRASLGTSCIYGLFGFSWPILSSLDRAFPPRQGGGRWFEPSIVHFGSCRGFGWWDWSGALGGAHRLRPLQLAASLTDRVGGGFARLVLGHRSAMPSAARTESHA